MVADTGTWLPGRRVLIPPFVLGNPDWASRLFPLHLKKQDIEQAPGLDEDAPVSRMYEKTYYKHFGWPYYWGAIYPVGGFIPASVDGNSGGEISQADIDKSTLRSVNEVSGYHIDTVDGRIGHVEDFILDDESWTIRYVVINIRDFDWLPGRKVLVSPEWISNVDCSEQKVFVELLRECIEKSPPYDPAQPINPEYEVRLYDFYGRPATLMKEPA